MMNIFKIYLLLGLCAVLGLKPQARAGTQVVCYVSPSGSDSNPGTENAPLKTIGSAQDAVRRLNGNMTGDLIVYLRGGTYTLANPVQFNEKDSGTNGHDIIYTAYPGETPIISGGVQVEGWTLDHDQIYKAPLHRETKLRTLFVNGVRADMTSTTIQGQEPQGTFTVLGTEPWAETPGATFDGIAFKSADLPVLKNPGDVELTQRRTWALPIVCIRDIQAVGDKTVCYLQQPYGAIAATMAWHCGIDPRGKCTIRNALELLTKPGQFYFDRASQTVYYFSRGEDMATASVIAPLSEGLLQIVGSSTTDRVHHLRFQGITFSYDHWKLKQVANSYGSAGVQSVGLYTRFRADGNWHKDHYDLTDIPQASVELGNCEAISFERNHFVHLSSGIGISLTNDVVNCQIVGNVFQDLSGNAVNIGHPQQYVIGAGPLLPKGIAGVCAHDVVKDNLIRNVSLDFCQEEGISAQFTEDVTIAHNDLKGLPYGAIAMGWWWADAGIPDSTVAKDNLIAFNRISKTHQVLGGDGGALYVIGDQPGSKIEGNYITASPRCIFPDQGAGWWTIEHNVLDNGHSAWLFVHFKSSHDLKIDGNYSRTDNVRDNGKNCPILSHHLELAPPWSPQAQAIIDSSGIESAYKDISDETPPHDPTSSK